MLGWPASIASFPTSTPWPTPTPSWWWPGWRGRWPAWSAASRRRRSWPCPPAPATAPASAASPPCWPCSPRAPPASPSWASTTASGRPAPWLGRATSGPAGMTTIAWFHPFSGIAGDGAGVAARPGADRDAVFGALAALPHPTASRSRRCSAAASAIASSCPTSPITTIVPTCAVRRCSTPPSSRPVQQRAAAVFERLAVVEGAIHGVEPDEVEFHQVGSLDAIVDVVGTCAALEDLGVDECARRQSVAPARPAAPTASCPTRRPPSWPSSPARRRPSRASTSRWSSPRRPAPPARRPRHRLRSDARHDPARRRLRRRHPTSTAGRTSCRW